MLISFAFTEKLICAFVLAHAKYWFSHDSVHFHFPSETDEQEADKSKRQREYLLSQVRLPTRETILRYPIEIWVSSGKAFVPPEGNSYANFV